MNIESLQQWIKTIKRSNPESQYIQFFTLLHKILYNIIHNDEEKYRKLIGSSKSFNAGIKNTTNGVEFLVEIGFIRTVENFVEYFSFSTLNSVTRCKLNDTLAEITAVLENLMTRIKTSEKMKTIKQMNAIRENEIQMIMKDFEADRADKDERNRRDHAKLRKSNERKENDIREKMHLLRTTMINKTTG